MLGGRFDGCGTGGDVLFFPPVLVSHVQSLNAQLNAYLDVPPGRQ